MTIQRNCEKTTPTVSSSFLCPIEQIYTECVNLNSLLMICPDLMVNGHTNIQYFGLVSELVCCMGVVTSMYFNITLPQRRKNENWKNFHIKYFSGLLETVGLSLLA